MPSTREVLATTIALEKETMGLYARFARVFGQDPKLREFWFAMARDEARHVGALELVSTVLDFDAALDKPSPVALDNATVARLRSLLQKYGDEAVSGISVERALTAAVDLEETELEDLAGNLLKALQERDEYKRYLRLLVHDLGDLSYMIEQYSQDRDLLQRCDVLVNRHAEELRLSAER